MPLSQLVLADALGMTPVHLNRVPKKLRLSGAMMIRRGSVAIADPTLMIQIAGFDENICIVAGAGQVNMAKAVRSNRVD